MLRTALRRTVMAKIGDDWRCTLLQPGDNLQKAIDTINRSGLQIALVVDAAGRLLGTITDGDVRRALLRNVGLNVRLDEVMNPTPMVVPPDIGRDAVVSLMRANKVHQLPIVEEGVVVGLHSWDEVQHPASRPNTIVLMAGGFGRRLRPLTEECPKPMLPVAGKPILQHIIERGCAEGFSNFVISLHYRGEMIRNYFGDGARWGIRVAYLNEDEPLGTAGAIASLDPVPGESFVVANGDVLSNVDYAGLLNFHQEHRAEATMAVRQHEWQHPYGVVRTEGIQITAFEEKPIIKTYVNAGIYAIEPTALTALSRGAHCDMPDLFERLQGAGRHTIAYPMHEPWLDIGKLEDLHLANRTR